MSSAIHDAKPQMASFHSEVGNGGFVISAVGLQTESMMDNYEDEEDSPYEEVRASVSNMDDPEMPVLTFRMWFIGIFLTVGSAAANTFFSFRNPQTYVTSLPVLCVERDRPVVTIHDPRETLGADASLVVLFLDWSRTPSVDSQPPCCQSATTSSQSSLVEASSPSIQVRYTSKRHLVLHRLIMITGTPSYQVRLI